MIGVSGWCAAVRHPSAAEEEGKSKASTLSSGLRQPGEMPLTVTEGAVRAEGISETGL